jgi:hypothetical protein
MYDMEDSPFDSVRLSRFIRPADKINFSQYSIFHIAVYNFCSTIILT